ncbi:hypothetical protein Tco_1247741 [Tanacetum coccineum]
MSTLKFVKTHNLVAFLEKPKESNGFEEIVDFLNASSIRYALTVGYVRFGNQSIERDRLIGFGFVLDFVEFISFTFGLTHYHQPSSSKPQKKKSRRKQRKDSAPTEPTTEETTPEEHVSTPSYDPPPSEDASKQGRKIEDLDADAEVTLVNETQEMNDDNLMFDTGMLEKQEIKFKKVVKEPVVSVATTTKSIPVSVAEVVTTASASVVILDELTLAQTLIEIKTAKPKPVTTIVGILNLMRQNK